MSKLIKVKYYMMLGYGPIETYIIFLSYFCLTIRLGNNHTVVISEKKVIKNEAREKL